MGNSSLLHLMISSLFKVDNITSGSDESDGQSQIVSSPKQRQCIIPVGRDSSVEHPLIVNLCSPGRICFKNTLSEYPKCNS
ncbi:hypothetical protein V6N12_051728 [Hibiscus sabdariffa]|uniref:Uncharacterized protein n=1 Tax=Hibiscus sabdariffa TaxID=183260 RepID=A0ABR2GGT7_9ROSI